MTSTTVQTNRLRLRKAIGIDDLTVLSEGTSLDRSALNLINQMSGSKLRYKPIKRFKVQHVCPTRMRET